ncbi:hypothetical protein [Bacillus mycoides]|uniref:hypothetical protein n=1 Tax=Bacillus mycoides TaxID=1405 RepID=UPI003D1B8943
MFIEILEGASILTLGFLLTLIVMFQDAYFMNIKEHYSETIIGMILVGIRMLLGTWIIFITETTIIAISKVTAIQLLILLIIWAFSKYVQKNSENWLITIVAFVIYGVGTYLYIQFALRGY